MAEVNIIPWKRLSVEAVAIVGSILLAFAIDAWWEDIQDARRQEKLVTALLLDFETTKTRLEASIEYAEALLDRTNKFFETVGSDELVSIDSLRYFGAGAFHKIDFEPALSVYEGAVATGEFGLIESPGLQESITEFNRALDSYELHDRITADIHYLGPIWDVRKEIGSLSVLFDDPSAYPIPINLTEAEIRQLYSDSLVTGAIEAVATANESILRNLRSMNEATAVILGELEKLQ
jgi:hypothetical protein